MAEIVNLTPHPIRIYPPGGFDVIEIPPSTEYPTARLGEIDLGTQTLGLGVPVEYVEYGRLVNPLPPQDDYDPHQTWYVVPLVVALTQTHAGRSDLLVTYDLVRNDEGTVTGCRMLARPV